MSLEVAPADATRHLAVLDELIERGSSLCHLLEQRAHAPDADHLALCQAFEIVARGVRRAIILSCSLTRLRTQSAVEKSAPAQPQAGCDPGAPVHHERPKRPERYDRLDTLDDLDDLDTNPDRSVPEIIADVVRDIDDAIATLEPTPPSLAPPSPAPPTLAPPTLAPPTLAPPTPILPLDRNPHPTPAARPSRRCRS